MKQAFEYGAGSAEPADAMWERIDREIRTRSRSRVRFVLQRSAVAAVVLLLLASATLLVSPVARAAVAHFMQGVVLVWEGRLGNTDAALGWADESQGWEKLQQQGISKITTPWTQFPDAPTAGRFLDFAPAEARLPAAVLARVEGRRSPAGDDGELRQAHLTYRVGGSDYWVDTSAYYRRRADQWVHLPYSEAFTTMVGPAPPANPRSVDLGSETAMCFDPAPGVPLHMCLFLQDGRHVQVNGPDPDLVVQLAKSIVSP
jgi:hypothetical protein